MLLLLQNEYTGLAFGAILLISSTIIYYITCIILELVTVCCPQRIGSIIGVFTVCCKSSTAKKIREAQLKAESSKQRSMRESSADTSSMAINPIMMQQKSAGYGLNADGYLDDIMGMDAPSGERVHARGARAAQVAAAPCSASDPYHCPYCCTFSTVVHFPFLYAGSAWSAIQGSYSHMTAMIRDLQAEVRMLKRDVASGVAPAGPTGPTPLASALRSRTQFKPMLRSGEEGGDDETDNPLAAGDDQEAKARPKRRVSTSSAASHAAAIANALGGYRAAVSASPGGLGGGGGGVTSLAKLRSARLVTKKARTVVIDSDDEDGAGDGDGDGGSSSSRGFSGGTDSRTSSAPVAVSNA